MRTTSVFVCFILLSSFLIITDSAGFCLLKPRPAVQPASDIDGDITAPRRTEHPRKASALNRRPLPKKEFNSFPATGVSIFADQERVCLGQNEGGIVICLLASGATVRVNCPSEYTGKAAGMLVIEDELWWVVTPNVPAGNDTLPADAPLTAPIISPIPAKILCCYNLQSRKSSAYPLSDYNVVRITGKWKGWVICNSGDTLCMIDPVTSQIIKGSNVPSEISQNSLYQAVNQSDIPTSPVAPTAGTSILSEGSNRWWRYRAALCRVDTARGETDAFMLCNIKDEIVVDFFPVPGGVWLLTNKAARLSRMNSSDRAGLVRVPIGENQNIPITAQDKKLAELVEEWQSAPYLWGGSSKTGTDCSGFLMAVYRELGINLPHGTAYLPGARGGIVVQDVLRFGDVLVYPGHCSIYLGNGQTAETITGKGVSKGSIWNRYGIQVRRFINIIPEKRVVSRQPGSRR